MGARQRLSHGPFSRRALLFKAVLHAKRPLSLLKVRVHAAVSIITSDCSSFIWKLESPMVTAALGCVDVALIGPLLLLLKMPNQIQPKLSSGRTLRHIT